MIRKSSHRKLGWKYIVIIPEQWRIHCYLIVVPLIVFKP
nr:MAG TPA: hypothetical protein [Caudoviricetes sp.]